MSSRSSESTRTVKVDKFDVLGPTTTLADEVGEVNDFSQGGLQKTRKF